MARVRTPGACRLRQVPNLTSKSLGNSQLVLRVALYSRAYNLVDRDMPDVA